MTVSMVTLSKLNCDMDSISLVAVVGLENTHQRVLVDEGGVVEVCVSVSRPCVDCPIPSPFNLTVSVAGIQT